MPYIQTADEAIEIADKLVAKYYPFKKLLKAVLEEVLLGESYWVVEFDVGILKPRVARMKLARSTGQVLEYTTSETV